MSNAKPPKSSPAVFLEADAFNIERVFPIRNLVGNADSPEIAPEASQADEKNDSGKFIYGDHQLNSPEHSSSSGTHNSNSSEERRKVAGRSRLVPSRSGAPGVLAGSVADNDTPTYMRCEDEPIHIPGAVQNFGALLGVKYSDRGNLEVRIASENTRKILGYGPEQLFALSSFLDIFSPDVGDEIVTRVGHALRTQDQSDAKIETRLDVFQMTIAYPYEPDIRLWCAIHLPPKSKGIVICEFEAFSDAFYLKDVGTAKVLPVAPVWSTGFDVSPQELEKSTTNKSKPLPVIEIARQRKQKEFSSLDIFNAMTQTQRQFSLATTVQEIFEITVGIIAELTGFHRVMFYRFDAQKNGCIEAEFLNPQASSDVYRGLHYPASDIPVQARELYKINRIRILHDRDSETARLVARHGPSDFVEPLDLTHSYLRAMSPVHITYLQNMGVRSTMSISIVINDDLWGLVACHGYGEAGIRVSLPIRELCRNIGDCAASSIERLIMIQRIEARKPPVTTLPTQHPAKFIAASSSDLLKVFDADFGLLSIHNEARAIGRLNPYREALAILAYLQKRKFNSCRSSQNINADFPQIKYAPGIHAISGLLIVPLSIGGGDFLVFFRRGQLREVKWAGNPYDRNYKAGSEYLEPRTSFKRWVETIVGMSKEWTEDQLETGQVLSLLYGRFIEIWRQKETASQNNRVARMLIRNSSKEVRTLLNAIVNYLEMALENKVDDLTRDILGRAEKASKSLIYTIDDLLKLTKAEEGPVHVKTETFDLKQTVSDLTTAFRQEAAKKNLDLTITTHEGIPEMVKGDASRLRQILTNLTRNAFQNSAEGGVKVDIRPLKSVDNISTISITIQDAGAGMTEQQLDDLFQHFEEVLDDEDQLPPADGSSGAPTSEKSNIGVGLALVARFVRATNGQIRVKSEIGKGTIFGVELPYEHAAPSPRSSPLPLQTDEPSSRTITTMPLLQPKSPSQLLQPPSPAPSQLPPEPPLINPQSKSQSPTPAHSETTHHAPSLSRSRSQDTSLPPFMHPSTPTTKQILQTIETTTHIESLFSPPTEMGPYAHNISKTDYDRALSLVDSDSEDPDNRDDEIRSQFLEMDSEGQTTLVHLNVLVVEDNPISLRLMNKRLARRGHTVVMACDGQEAHDVYVGNIGGVDVILMDLEINGALSARMIRYYEKELWENSSKSRSSDSQYSSATEGEKEKERLRVPIIAVSGELVEESRFEYIQSGFDGWILKPIDFRRLDTLLKGVKIPEIRREALYVPGKWGEGGWFLP